MARCGCSGECNCVVTAGDCITVTGNGNPGTPYAINVKIDNDAGNQLTCVADAPGDEGGLYVPAASVEVDDTDCIALSGTGFTGDPILATPILDVDVCNLLACSATGLTAEITTADSDCINLAGCGTVGDPLIADLNISADVGNIFECRADGGFVPPAGSGVVSIYGSLGLAGAYATPAGVGSVLVQPFPFNVVQQNVGNITDLANNGFLVPAGGAGWYHVAVKFRETITGNSFEATGDYFQIHIQISGSGRVIAERTIDLLTALDHYYEVADVVYLAAADTVVCNWNLFESTNLLAIGAHTMDVVAWGDGTYPCAFEIERIGV